jgi:hypothetical protein
MSQQKTSSIKPNIHPQFSVVDETLLSFSWVIESNKIESEFHGIQHVEQFATVFMGVDFVDWIGKNIWRL